MAGWGVLSTGWPLLSHEEVEDNIWDDGDNMDRTRKTLQMVVQTEEVWESMRDDEHCL